MEPVLSHVTLFHFIRPWFLLSLIPAVLLFIFLWLRKPNYGSWHHVISPHLLPHLLQGTVKQQGKFPLVLLLVSWIIASFALAGPTWSKLPQTVQKKINAKVILLDLSLSMLAQDLKPSRLTRAQHKLSDILDQSKEGLTGLITYAGTSHVVSPLTDDTHTILSMVTSLSPEIMPIKGSDPIAAIEKATQLLQQAGITEGQILLITDDVPADFVGKVKQFLNPSLTPVSIFAIGTSEGAPIPLSKGSFVRDRNGAIVVPKLNIQRLKASAKALNGRFSTLSSDDEDINYLLENTNRLLNDEMIDTDRDFDTWNEHGLFLVLLLLPLAAMGYRKGWLSLFILPTLTSLLLVAAPQSVEASPWNDLWTTKDQQGQQAWQNKRLKEASQLFNNPEWKASAQYKSGNYLGSSDTLKQHVTTEAGDTADNHYNLGNALAKQQDFTGALDAYEQALKLNPDMEDAKKNQTLVKQIEKQEQEQEQEQQDDGENKDGDDKESSDQQQDKKDSDQQSGDDEQDSEGQKSEQENQEQTDQKKGADGQKPDSDSDQEQQSQPQSEQNDDEEKEDAQSQQQPKEGKSNDEDTSKEQQPTTADIQESNLNKEDQQALEQWLRRIPDDPGGLLRRKFSQESKLRRNQPVEDKQW